MLGKAKYGVCYSPSNVYQPMCEAVQDVELLAQTK